VTGWEKVMRDLRRDITLDGEEKSVAHVFLRLTRDSFTPTWPVFHPIFLPLYEGMALRVSTDIGVIPDESVWACRATTTTPLMSPIFDNYGVRRSASAIGWGGEVCREWWNEGGYPGGVVDLIGRQLFRVLLLKDATKGTWHLISTAAGTTETRYNLTKASLAESFGLPDTEAYSPNVQT